MHMIGPCNSVNQISSLSARFFDRHAVQFNDNLCNFNRVEKYFLNSSKSRAFRNVFDEKDFTCTEKLEQKHIK